MMRLLPESRKFIRSLLLLVILNALVKPAWIFGIDRQVQNMTGYASYGNYFALLNLTMVLNVMLDLGITPFFNRVVASDHDRGPALFSQAFYIKFLLAFLYSAAVFALAFFSGASSWSLLAMLVLLQVLTSISLLLRSWLSASQQFHHDAWVSITDKLFVILVAGAILVMPGNGVISISRFVWIQVGGLLLAIGLALVFLRGKTIRVSMASVKGADFGILRSSLPFALNIFFMSALARADGFMLERLHGNGSYEAGVYASGFRLVDAVNMGGYLLASFLLPFIARHWPDKNTIEPIIRNCRHALLLSGILAAVFVWSYAAPLNNLLYHGRDTGAASVIRLLMVCLPFMGLTHVYGTLLTATGHIRVLMRISGLFALLNIIMNTWAIPAYGSTGAAWVAIGTQAGFAFAVLVAATRLTKISFRFADILLYSAFTGFLILGLKYLIL